MQIVKGANSLFLARFAKRDACRWSAGGLPSALSTQAERRWLPNGSPRFLARLTKQEARRWKVLRRAPGTHDPAAPKTFSWRRERWPDPQRRREPKGRSGLKRWSSWQFPIRQPPAAGRTCGGRPGGLPSHAGSHRNSVRASVGRAVHLRVEGLGVECAGWGCHAGENRQGDQGGYDGLHGYYSRRCRQHHVACHRMSRIIARRQCIWCSAGNTFPKALEVSRHCENLSWAARRYSAPTEHQPPRKRHEDGC